MENSNPLRADSPSRLTSALRTTPFNYMYSTYSFRFPRALEGDEYLLAEESRDLSTWRSLRQVYDPVFATPPANFVVDYSDEELPYQRFFRARAGVKGTERIPTLYNTGVFDNRQVMPDNYVDLHWEAGAFIGGAWKEYGFAYHRNSQFGFPIFPAGPWYGDNSTSGWLGYSPTFAGGISNTYVYRTTFNIPYGIDPRTVAISGRMTSDNETYYVFLNSAGAIDNGNTLITGDGNDTPVPAPTADGPARYRTLHTLLRTGRVRACHDLSEGGLAVALAEMCIGGRLGATVNTLPTADPTTALFSESNGRFVCEVPPDDLAWFLDGLGRPAVVLGTVTTEPVLRLAGVELSIDALRAAFQGGAR